MKKLRNLLIKIFYISILLCIFSCVIDKKQHIGNRINVVLQNPSQQITYSTYENLHDLQLKFIDSEIVDKYVDENNFTTYKILINRDNKFEYKYYYVKVKRVLFKYIITVVDRNNYIYLTNNSNILYSEYYYFKFYNKYMKE